MADEHILSQEELDALLGNGEEGDEASIQGHTLGEAFRVVLRSTGEALGRLAGADIRFSVSGVLDSVASVDVAPGAYQVLYSLSGDVHGQIRLLLAQPFVEAIVGVLNEGDPGEQDEVSEVLAEAMQVAGGALRETLSEVLSSEVEVAVEQATSFDPEAQEAELPADAVVFRMTVRFGDMEPTAGYVLIPEGVADTCMELIIDAANGEDAASDETSDISVATFTTSEQGSTATRAETKDAASFRPAEFAPLGSGASQPVDTPDGNLDLLLDVPLRVTVELGRTTMQIRDILGLRKGQVIELDKLAGEPVDVFVNAKLIAKGEVVVMDEHFGVRITHIVSRNERFQNVK